MQIILDLNDSMQRNKFSLDSNTINLANHTSIVVNQCIHYFLFSCMENYIFKCNYYFKHNFTNVSIK